MSKPEGTVLIVDDSKNNISVLKLILKQRNYKGIGALSGDEAISLLEEMEPDLILMDIMMPVMTGFEACKKIKSNPNTADIPIIFLSALDDKESRLQGFEVGGQDYIIKPFSQEETIARVETHIRLKKLRDKDKQHAKDMEEFAFMAAHDLRAPTTTIDGFCDIISETDSNDEINSHITHVKRCSGYLRNLVDSLLGLADLSHDTGAIETLQWSKITKELLQDLEPTINKNEATLLFSDNDLEFSGNSTHFKILLTNLIGNSIKFRKDDQPPHIEITAKIEEEVLQITVQDNGIGFPQEQADNIFKPFQRLKGGSKYQGHGLGLSICKKIVSRYEGTISARSLPDQGCIIQVIIPL